jgi:hypothetical protein
MSVRHAGSNHGLLRWVWLILLALAELVWLAIRIEAPSALHGRWLAGTVAGMCYAFAMYRRGKVADAVTAHATTNGLIAADVLILKDWDCGERDEGRPRGALRCGQQ